MSLVQLSVKHGRSLEDARTHLGMTVEGVRARFGPMIQHVEWSDDRNSVRLSGIGFTADLSVDALEVHVTADVPLLGGLLSSPLVAGLKQVVQQTFHKQLQ